jgi:hypothetical protein
VSSTQLVKVSNKINDGYRYGYGNHEKDNEIAGEGNHLSFGDYGYDTRIGRRWNVEPLIKKYPSLSSYAVFANNPIFYADPDGREIIISYKVGEETKTMNYSYVKDRKFEDGTPDFVKNTVMALDQLQSTGAMNIKFGEGGNAKTVDVLGQFIGSKEHNLTIGEGASNNYTPSTNNVSFNSTQGAEFRKDLDQGFTEENTGRNSASALLGHEIIHGYNDEFDNANYTSRKTETMDKTVAPFFPNKEEKEVTTNLANQVNKTLGQDQRTHYKRNYYNTESSTSTKKKTP